MTDNIESPYEGIERPLNEREVFNKFEQILDGREFTELGKVEDENGLYTWDLRTIDQSDGEPLDISYQRGRVFKNGVSTESRITQTLYSGGRSCGAGTQYDYIGGEWVEKN